MKKFSLALIFFILLEDLMAQSLFTNPITGTNPAGSNPYTTGQLHHGALIVSGIGRGPGISAAAANDRYNASGWTTSATTDVNDYFEWTLTPVNGYQLNLAGFSFNGQRSASGPQFFSLRSSLDGFAADVGTAMVSGTTIPLSETPFQHITTSISFRLYGWGASAGSGTFSVNDFSFSGTVVSLTLPVRFSKLELKKVGKEIFISWTNLTEESVMDYRIERALAGNAFQEIGRQVALYNDNQEHHYQFLDQHPPEGKIFYRIAANETGGKKVYSRVLEIQTQALARVSIHPNPARDHFYLQCSGLPPGKYLVELFNSLGQPVLVNPVHHTGGELRKEIILPPLGSGMYYGRLGNHNWRLWVGR